MNTQVLFFALTFFFTTQLAQGAAWNPPKFKNETVLYSWQFKNETWKLPVNLHKGKSCARHYRFSKQRVGNWLHYVENDPCESFTQEISERLLNMARRHRMSRREAIDLALAFSNAFTYSTDRQTKGIQNYYRFPYETIRDAKGDCEDFAFLFVAIMSDWCVPSAIIRMTTEYGGVHVAAAVGMQRLEHDQERTLGLRFDGHPYLYAETTGCTTKRCKYWKVGEAPQWRDQATLTEAANVPLRCKLELE